MRNLKFKLVIAKTGKAIGYEYMTAGGWINQVFDYPERRGAFDEMELGDGFIDLVERRQYIGSSDSLGKEIFEGDELVAPSGNLFKVVWSDSLSWKMTDKQGVEYGINAGILKVNMLVDISI